MGTQPCWCMYCLYEIAPPAEPLCCLSPYRKRLLTPDLSDQVTFSHLPGVVLQTPHGWKGALGGSIGQSWVSNGSSSD